MASTTSNNGALGSHYMIADVGTEQCLAEDYGVHDKLIPQYLVPPHSDGQPHGNDLCYMQAPAHPAPLMDTRKTRQAGWI